MNLFDLTGKVAIVTGGNGGIGLAMARGLAGAGARVVVAARDRVKGAQAAAVLGGDAVFLPADVTRKSDCVDLIADTVAHFGRVDILINNAGMSVRKPPQDYTEAEWHTVLDTNLTSVFLLSQAAYPEMTRVGLDKKAGGKIINIGSMLSLFGLPLTAAYAASKGAVVQFTKATATAWAKDNIQCNAILPGWVDTDLTRNARVEIDGLNETVLSRTPAGRWGVPDDLAGIAVFLASSASDFVTGTAIPCDGGFSAKG